MDALVSFAQFFGAPTGLAVVSIMYFLGAKGDPSLVNRVFSSAHGLSVCLIFAVAAYFWISRTARPQYINPYLISHALPLILVAYSLVKYRGPKWIHLLLIPGIIATLWTMFIGAMAVTGDWL